MLYPRLLALAALTAACCGSAAARAADNGDVLTIKQASAGFGGKCKSGFWQPVRLTVVAGPRGAKGRLELIVPDGDQVPVIYRDASRGQIDLAASQEETMLLYAKSGPIAAPFTVQLTSDSGSRWSRELPALTPTLRSTQELIVGVGPSLSLDEVVAAIRRRPELALQATQLKAADILPDRWWGYDGVDCLVLATSDAEFMARLSADQRQAIVQWVQFGGRIVVCVGSRGADIAAADSPWSPLIPGTLAEVDFLRERTGLENFTKAELPFDTPQFQRHRPAVTRLKDVRGEVLVEEASSGAARPLVVHAAAGLGQVTFVGLDLDHPSLKEWKGRQRLLATLLQVGTPHHQPTDREVHRGVTHLGYDDLIGQLRAALDQFPGVTLVNFTTVSVITIVYLLLIGPADYFLLSRLALPRHLTWVTLPAAMLVTIGLAGIIDRRVHGQRVRLNQAEIVDIDLATQAARGTFWAHLYSPATRRFDAQLHVVAPQGVIAAPLESSLAWQGLPGDSLGGLESRQPALVSREPYVVALPGSTPGLEGLVVQVASSKSLAARWTSRASLPAGSRLTIDRFGLLAGEFLQPLPIELSDCLLAHGEKLYRLGRLGTGERVQMAELPPLNLEARLTQRRVEQSKDVSTPWEQDSVDVPRVMQMLMFHESARGSSYTGLTHRYQPEIDLSEHIRLGQAVLVGRAASAAGTLRVPRPDDGTRSVPTPSETLLAAPDDTHTWTWYRIIMPVSRLQLATDN